MNPLIFRKVYTWTIEIEMQTVDVERPLAIAHNDILPAPRRRWKWTQIIQLLYFRIFTIEPLCTYICIAVIITQWPRLFFKLLLIFISRFVPSLLYMCIQDRRYFSHHHYFLFAYCAWIWRLVLQVQGGSSIDAYKKCCVHVRVRFEYISLLKSD